MESQSVLDDLRVLFSNLTATSPKPALPNEDSSECGVCKGVSLCWSTDTVWEDDWTNKWKDHSLNSNPHTTGDVADDPDLMLVKSLLLSQIQRFDSGISKNITAKTQSSGSLDNCFGGRSSKKCSKLNLRCKMMNIPIAMSREQLKKVYPILRWATGWRFRKLGLSWNGIAPAQIAPGRICVNWTRLWPSYLVTISTGITFPSRAGMIRSSWNCDLPISQDPGKYKIHTTIITLRKQRKEKSILSIASSRKTCSCFCLAAVDDGYFLMMISRRVTLVSTSSASASPLDAFVCWGGMMAHFSLTWWDRTINVVTTCIASHRFCTS